jgi:hypothetical protein
MSLQAFEKSLTPAERVFMDSLDSPRKIQDFLDEVVYEPEYFNRCPLRVLRERRGHCFDGALFGALALSRLGHPPVIVDLLPAPLMDDDHVLALFRQNGGLGAVAKSNTSGLRFRDPVYRGARELVMSYFEDYYNTLGLKSLRGYTLPFNLRPLGGINWTVDDAGCDAIEHMFGDLPRRMLLTPEMARSLSKVDKRAFDAGLLGADPAGLYAPGIA